MTPLGPLPSRSYSGCHNSRGVKGSEMRQFANREKELQVSERLGVSLASCRTNPMGMRKRARFFPKDKYASILMDW